MKNFVSEGIASDDEPSTVALLMVPKFAMYSGGVMAQMDIVMDEVEGIFRGFTAMAIGTEEE